MANAPTCPLCEQTAFVGNVANRDAHGCRCDACGEFIFTPEAATLLTQDPIKASRFVLSGLTRSASDRGSKLELTTQSIPKLLGTATQPRTPYDVLDPLLLAIHAATRDLTEFAGISYNDYPLFGLRSAEQLNEFLGLLQDLDYIHLRPLAGQPGVECRLTLGGWDRVAELRAVGRSASRAFVAMSFAENLDIAWAEGFEPALRDAGWEPVRMDRLHHNERIDDRILAEIRRSGLVIADFTGQRAGVYFEAGFALGLGIPVIWTVHQTELADVHFDTRQYNHIDWGTPADLRRRLHDRLVATIATPPS